MENDKRDVIDWLNDMANDEQWHCYYSDSELRLLAKDALELLKAQEPIQPIRSPYGEWLCGNCMREIDKYAGDYHCPGCGREVKWE